MNFVLDNNMVAISAVAGAATGKTLSSAEPLRTAFAHSSIISQYTVSADAGSGASSVTKYADGTSPSMTQRLSSVPPTLVTHLKRKIATTPPTPQPNILSVIAGHHLNDFKYASA